jgi:hypothetical protein
MIKRATRTSLAAAILALGVRAVVAQDVPTLNVEPLCKAEAKQAAGLAENCMNDQKQAREDLAKQWAQFTPASRKSCLQLVTGIPGIESYVELLTCLQMKQEVRELPKQ